MSKTEVSGKQVKDGSIELVDLSSSLQSTISGKADASSVSADISSLDGRVDALEGNVGTLNNVGALNDLSDVAITSPSADQVLKYDGVGWVNAAAPAAGATNLDGLSDVAITSAAKGHFLAHNGTSFVNTRTIEADVAATVPLTVKAAASQSGNLFNITDSANSNLVAVTSSGAAYFNGGGWNSAPLVVTGEIGNNPAFNIRGVVAGGSGNYGLLRIMGSGTGIIDFETSNSAGGSWNGRILGGAGLITIGTSSGASRGYPAWFGGWNATYPSLSLVALNAAAKGLIVKGAASQTANLFEVQKSDGNSFVYVAANGNLFSMGPSLSWQNTLIGRDTGLMHPAFGSAINNTGVGAYALNYNTGQDNVAIGNNTLRGAASGTMNGGANTALGCNAGTSITTGSRNVFVGYKAGSGVTSDWNNVIIGYHDLDADTANAGHQISIGYMAVTSGSDAIAIGGRGVSAAADAIALGRGATAAANCLDIRFGNASRITGDSSGNVAIANTLHAKRYTETVANAFNTSLAPSSGTLTVDTSVGNAVLGALSASVTTWAFTNVPADNSKITTVSAVVAGNTSYTYGSSCSVNGSAVATGVQWFGGTAPTPSSTTDVLTFAIVRDSAGTIRVLGSAQTIDSVIGSASAGIDGAGSANYLSKWTDANTIANSAVFESGGNVGIGTISPSAKLDIASSFAYNATGNDMLRLTNTSATGQTIIQSNINGTLRGRVRWDYVGNMNLVAGGGDFIYYTGADSGGAGTAERMRLTSAGNLGIGNLGASASRVEIQGSDSTSSNYGLTVRASNSAHTFYTRNDGLINTGLQSQSPYNATTASAANLVVDANGSLLRSTSSLKYKTDVQDATHGLNEVLQLRPVTYKGNNDGNKVFGGLIAEEVHEVGLSEFVQYAADGSPDALNYANMVSLAFKAIQELNAKVDALQAEKEALEARIAAIENN